MVGQRIGGREYYTVLAGGAGGAAPTAPGGGGTGPGGREQDLFAGL
jgi:hypothetical protein